MAMQASCPGCRQSVSFTEPMHGKRVRCQKCQKIFALSGIKSPEQKTSPASAGTTAKQSRNEETTPRKKKRRKKAASGKIIWIVSGAIGLVAIFGIGIGIWLAVGGRRPVSQELPVVDARTLKPRSGVDVVKPTEPNPQVPKGGDGPPPVPAPADPVPPASEPPMPSESAPAPEPVKPAPPKRGPNGKPAVPRDPNVLALAEKLRSELTDADAKAGTPSKTFYITLEAGKSYFLEYHSNDYPAVFRLEDPKGELVKEGDSTPGPIRPRNEVIAPITGKYTIVASTKGAVGKFELQVSEDPRRPEEVFFGFGIFHQISTLNGLLFFDKKFNASCKYFDMNLTAGKPYHFDIRANAMQLGMRLEDSNGDQVVLHSAKGIPTTAQFSHTSAAGGRHRLVLASLSGVGFYSLTIHEDKAIENATKLLKSGPLTIQGELTGPANRLAYFLPFKAGQRYHIEASSEAFSSSLDVWDWTGGGTKSGYVPPQKKPKLKFFSKSNVLCGVAIETNGGKGKFELTVSEDNGATAPDEVSLASGFFEAKSFFNASDEIDPKTKAPRKVYAATFEANKTYTIQIKVPELPASGGYPQTRVTARVESADGAEVARNDGNFQVPARIVYKAPKTQSYRVIATTSGGFPGSQFILSIDAERDAKTLPKTESTRFLVLNPHKALPFPSSLERSDFIDSKTGKPRKAFDMELDGGDKYTFKVVTDGFRPTLKIAKRDGEELKFGKGQQPGEVEFVCPKDGVYRLYVSTADEPKGTFMLHVTPAVVVPSDNGPFVSDLPKGRIAVKFEEDTFKIDARLDAKDAAAKSMKLCKVYSATLPKNDRLTIELSSPDFDGKLMILGPTAKLIAEADAKDKRTAKIEHTTRYRGVYFILVTSPAGQGGNYQLTIRQKPFVPKPDSP